jgi:heptosyltransferase I
MTSKTNKRAGWLAKFADFYLGVPLVALIGALRWLFQGHRPPPAKIERIAMIQTAALGDTIIMSSVWHDLRAAFPKARISVYAGESNLGLARLLFGAANVSLLPVKRPLESLRLCRRESADIVLDFGPWPRWNALLALAIPARWRAGFRTAGQHRHYGYDTAVLHSGQVHELANHRALVASLGVATIHPPAIPEEVFAGEMPSLGPLVILHGWAGGFMPHHREWPSDFWVELARRFTEAGFEVELSGAPSDREDSQALAKKMRAAGVNVRDRAGEFDLAQMTRHLRAASAVISVNTGIMHLAAVTGVLTLGLNGPSQARRWGAVGPQAYNIESPCRGCGFLDLGFEYPKTVPPCMQAITVDQVWKEFQTRYAAADIFRDRPAVSLNPRSLEKTSAQNNNSESQLKKALAKT